MSRVVVISGNRNCYDQQAVTDMMAAHLREDDEIWTGGSSGVESLATRQAVAWGMSHETMLAHWKVDGETDPDASAKRYTNLAENCDVVLVLWDGADSAILKLINAAIGCNREIHIHPWKR